jgi:hypothetical protein
MASARAVRGDAITQQTAKTESERSKDDGMYMIAAAGFLQGGQDMRKA